MRNSCWPFRDTGPPGHDARPFVDDFLRLAWRRRGDAPGGMFMRYAGPTIFPRWNSCAHEPRGFGPLLLALSFCLAACAAPSPAERKLEAEALAAEFGGGEARVIETSDFDLYARTRGTSAPLLVVYIEGDGLAWTNRTTASADPTPVDPVALKLALLDKHDAVAYLARPCQYTGRGDGSAGRNCRTTLWTSARYGEEVVAAMDEAVDRLMREAGAHEVALVGFSGGGTVASLIAARRGDVAWLKTVASPLDIAAFTRHHAVSPLAESLNPIDAAATLSRVPQVHYSGAEDEVVPAPVNDAYMAALASGGCASRVIVAGAGHREGWTAAWPAFGMEEPRCAAAAP